jgi:uncharacterized protein YkwD
VLKSRPLLTVALPLLGCVAIALCAPTTAVAADTGAQRQASAADQTLARTACAKHAADKPRHAHGARACPRPQKTHASKLHKARPEHAHKPRPTSPETEPTPASTNEASDEQTPSSAHTASIASVLATPCQNTELTPEAANLPVVRAAVLCLINRKRAENGENPLTPNPELEQAAEGHCQEMIADDYFAHVSPSGETPVDRIRDAGYIPSPSDGYVIGENLAWGTYQLSTPQAIVAAWIASPGHLANILETQYVETGIAVTPAVPSSLAPGATGATYAQEFGVIIQ